MKDRNLSSQNNPYTFKDTMVSLNVYGLVCELKLRPFIGCSQCFSLTQLTLKKHRDVPAERIRPDMEVDKFE